MRAFGKLFGALLLLLELTGSTVAAIPEAVIQVRFSSGGCRLPSEDAVGVVYELQAVGRLLSGKRLREELLSSVGTPDERIAETVRNGSGLGPRFCIFLTIYTPESTNFSTIMQSIERLKRLAAANAAPGCKVEIVVLPAAKVVYSPEAARQISEGEPARPGDLPTFRLRE